MGSRERSYSLNACLEYPVMNLILTWVNLQSKQQAIVRNIQDLGDGIEILKLTRYLNNTTESDLALFLESKSLEFRYRYIETQIKNSIQVFNSFNFDKVKRVDQFEIGKILAIILINCYMNKSKPICEAAKKLKEEPACLLTKIIDRINKNTTLLRNVKFYEDLLREKSNIETNVCDSTTIVVSDEDSSNQAKTSTAAQAQRVTNVPNKKENLENCQLRSEILRIKKDYTELRETLNEEIRNYNKLESKYSYLDNAFEQSKELVRLREATIKNREETIRELSDLKERLELLVASQLDEIKSNSTNLESVRVSLRQKETELKELNSVKASAEQQTAKSMQEINEKNLALQNENQMLKDKLVELQMTKEKEKNDREQYFNRRIDFVKSSLQKQIDQAKKATQMLGNTVASDSYLIKDLKKTLVDRDAFIDQKTKELEASQLKIVSLDKKMSEAAECRFNLEKKLKENESLVSDLKTKNDTYHKHQEDLKKLCAKLNEEKNSLQAKLDELNAANEQLKLEAQKSSTESDKLQSKCAAIEGKLSSLVKSSELAEVNFSEIKKVKAAEIKNLEEFVNRLNNEIDGLKKEKAETQEIFNSDFIKLEEHYKFMFAKLNAETTQLKANKDALQLKYDQASEFFKNGSKLFMPVDTNEVENKNKRVRT